MYPQSKVGDIRPGTLAVRRGQTTLNQQEGSLPASDILPDGRHHILIGKPSLRDFLHFRQDPLGIQVRFLIGLLRHQSLLAIQIQVALLAVVIQQDPLPLNGQKANLFIIGKRVALGHNRNARSVGDILQCCPR